MKKTTIAVALILCLVLTVFALVSCGGDEGDETDAGAYLFDPEALAEKLKDCKTDAVAVIHVFPLRRFSELHEIEPTVPARMIYPADGDELTL